MLCLVSPLWVGWWPRRPTLLLWKIRWTDWKWRRFSSELPMGRRNRNFLDGASSIVKVLALVPYPYYPGNTMPMLQLTKRTAYPLAYNEGYNPSPVCCVVIPLVLIDKVAITTTRRPGWPRPTGQPIVPLETHPYSHWLLYRLHPTYSSSLPSTLLYHISQAL